MVVAKKSFTTSATLKSLDTISSPSIGVICLVGLFALQKMVSDVSRKSCCQLFYLDQCLHNILSFLYAVN